MIKRIICTMLVSISILFLSSCKGDKKPTESTNNSSNPDFVDVDRMDYDNALGEFYSIYSEARDNKDNISYRYAQMAISEAKLLESGVMLPTKTNGGSYGLSKVVPKTLPYALWGNDYDRLYRLLVCNEPIKTKDRNTLIQKWNIERKNDDFNYEEYAKEYLKNQGYSFKNTYTASYTSDIKNWDILATSRAVDAEGLVNTYSGLYEYDLNGNLIPILARSYSVSEDGLTYTFNIKPNIDWLDSQGRKITNLTARDYVAGFQHMLDAAGGLEYLVQGVIKNAREYVSGEIKDFNQVGVRAIDAYTLEYQLEEKVPYFMSMLGYGVFAPLCKVYYESRGGGFGDNYNPTSSSYAYAKDKDSIAYCGPYIITNATTNNSIKFEANKSYFDYDNIDIKTITWLYNDSKDATKGYNDYMAGTTDIVNLNTQGLQLAKQDGVFDTYSYITDTDSTTFSNFMNIKRQSYVNVQDGKGAPSLKTEDQKRRAEAAMKNRNFRLAIAFGIDRKLYNAASVGNDLALFSIRNSYIPYDFVTLKEDTTIAINGEEYTFEKGTLFGEIVQAQLDKDNCPIIAYNKELGSSDGYDGWYNPLNAKEYLKKAISELKIDISKDNPIYLDLPYYSASQINEARAYAIKNSIEASLDKMVIVNLINCQIDADWFNCGYYTNAGSEANYDMYDLSGWGPDYGDPQTYLDTFLPEGMGYMTKCIGLY